LQAVADAEENERKRIAADLHDNLGAFAASIASNLDLFNIGDFDDQYKTALQELNKNSQSIVSQLGDTIWALNRDNLTLTAISDRIKLFLNQLKKSYSNIDMIVLENINQDIEDVKNLSDEEYQKICERIEKEKEEFEEESSEMEKILSKVGLTIEEWDNMSIDDSSEFLFNLAKTSPTLLKELEKDFDNFYKKYPTLID
jgi:hypothetical protein